MFRWEFRPGPAPFLVWSTEATGDSHTGALTSARDVERLASVRGPQALMIKLTYWLAR